MHLIGYNSGYLTSFREQLFPPYGSHTSCLKKKKEKRKTKRRRSRVITDVLFCERVVKGLLVTSNTTVTVQLHHTEEHSDTSIL